LSLVHAFLSLRPSASLLYLPHTHTRTHARARAHTHTHTHARGGGVKHGTPARTISKLLMLTTFK
jgi:hypothetical protein